MVYILCTLIDTSLCKPDDGQSRSKHIADVTSCRIQLSIVLCKDGLIHSNLSYVHSGMETAQFKFVNIIIKKEMTTNDNSKFAQKQNFRSTCSFDRCEHRTLQSRSHILTFK